MAGGVIYLDIDDEITSAASRIRSTEGSRVAVVLPNGSRVATSRINFRLLARDAMTNGKRLSVVAPDPATRALAASAGLPIFATVGEYESSLADGRADAAVDAGPVGIAGRAGAADDEEPILISETVATPAPKPDGPRGGGAARGARARPDAGAAGPAGAGAAGAAEAGAAGAAGTLWAVDAADATTESPAAAARPVPPPTPASGEPRRTIRTPAAVPAARVVADTSEPDPRRSRPEPAGRALRWPQTIGRTPIAIGLAVLLLALIVGGAAGFLFLPTARATIQPREASIGPVPLRIVASTPATAPDPKGLVVPAQLLTVPVDASDTFPATGKRVEETKAHGVVRFDNLDPTSSNMIPKGSVVSTGSGIRFSTDTAIRIPAAKLVGLTIVPSRASVKVTAVDAGPDGNVEPRAITTVPRDEEPFFLKVTNPDATTGGTHEEFPRVKQEDVDTATAALTAQLAAAFDEQLKDPALPGNTASTVFPETKALGAPVFAVNPATLVGKEVETFDLAATASGTVIAVDTAPVQTVAEAQIASSVDPGYALIDGSSNIDPAPATVTDGVITFPVTVSARQVLVLDAEAIKREIMGKPLQQAREILATYGEAQLEVWPDWVGTVPTLDSRVEVSTSGEAQ